MNNWVKAIISIGAPLAVGATAGAFTVTGLGSWYQSIEKPSWNPPNAVFGPVWTALYILMGIALFLVWKSNASEDLKRRAIAFFTIQLVLNFFWSLIFFNWHSILGALVEIMVLWTFILMTIFAFARINKAAAWLLVPYIAWVSFAALLNAAIYSLNN